MTNTLKPHVHHAHCHALVEEEKRTYTLEGAARSGLAAASALGTPTAVPARSRNEGVTIS